MLPTRPDLSDISEEVRLYIEALEKLIKRDISSSGASEAAGMLQDGPRTMFDSSSEVGWTEPPTKVCLITSTSKGIAKRTFRHLYTRQRRGGMGVFDLETSEGDPPSIIALAEESRNLIILTDHARAFRLPVRHFVDAPVRNRGNSITSKLNLLPQEKLLVILPDKAEGYMHITAKEAASIANQCNVGKLVLTHF